MSLKQETDLHQNTVNSWNIRLGCRVPGVWSFQDSRVCVSVVLLLKVVIPPDTVVSSVLKVCIKNYGAVLILTVRPFAKEDPDREEHNKLMLVN